MKTRIVVPFLSVILLATTPVLAEQPHPSTRNEATGAGAATTDPGVGSDRIPPDASAPTGEAGKFEERDRDRERRLRMQENREQDPGRQDDQKDRKKKKQHQKGEDKKNRK